MTKPVVLWCAMLVSQAVAQTQVSIVADACKGYVAREAELRALASAVIQARPADPAFAAAFEQAQQAWITFREAHLKSVYPDPAQQGSMYSACRCRLVEQLTAARIDQIRQRWVTGVREGDACAGTSAVQKMRPPKRGLKR